MFEDLGPLRDSIRDVILTSDVDMGMIRLTQLTRVRIQKSPILRRFLLRLRRRSVGPSETVYPAVVPSGLRPAYMLEIGLGFKNHLFHQNEVPIEDLKQGNRSDREV